VYTDGACSGNPGPGGWAWAVVDGPYASGAEKPSTNQRMEVTAAYQAVLSNPGPLEVVSDSTYVVNCFRDRWFDGWRKRGWLNTARKPVANRDLWEPFVDLVESRGSGTVRFRWVKGHSGDVMNDVVDKLAVEAALTQTPRTGSRVPSAGELGPADAPRAADGRVTLPAGYKVLVSGHRPPELGGYEANPVAGGVLRQLTEILAALAVMHPDLLVVTGLGLGAEQLGAEAALAAGVPYAVVQPYPSPESVWPDAAQERYHDLARQASVAVLLERKAPDTKQKAGAALRRRDAWLARNVDEAVVVWNGADSVVGSLVRSLNDHVGEEQVWIVTPSPDNTSARYTRR
jgi:ribonuclease HI/uncharacterized phage-like protein YoqJ